MNDGVCSFWTKLDEEEVNLPEVDQRAMERCFVYYALNYLYNNMKHILYGGKSSVI
jgi:hypothetical protein